MKKWVKSPIFSQVTVNKVAAVYEALLEENMVASGVALAPITATKKVWVPLET